MDDLKLPPDLEISKDNRVCKHLEYMNFPDISLPNQDGNLLKLNREDTFRIVLYCFPMTGRPDRPLPKNWNNIPGAIGCTVQTCSIRDHYDKIVNLNALPVGVSTQSVEDLKEMSVRLSVPYDILSDAKLDLKNILNLPTFSIKNKHFIRRLTLIIENKIIKKIFYPVFSPDKHINDVIEWLKLN